MQRLGALLATTVILGLAACGDDKPDVNASRDKVALLPERASAYKLTRAEREFRSCLTGAGIQVVIPRVASAPLSARIVPDVHGVADSFVWVSHRPTDAAKRVARDCAEESKESSADPARELIDELGTAEPEIQKPGSFREAFTPGSGGFIETPRSLSTREVPNKFKGATRRIYAQAEYVCGQTPKRFVQAMSALDLAKLFSKVYPKAWREAALEGCRAGFQRNRP